MEKFNIVKPEKYTDKQGVEKTYWANIGTMTKFFKQDGTTNTIIEIPAIGLKANVFPITPKVEKTAQQIDEERPNEPVVDVVDGRDLSEIPF